jgi:hypothetical protein
VSLLALRITTNKLGFLLLVWAFFLALATLGFNIPTVMLIVGTLLYLFE